MSKWMRERRKVHRGPLYRRILFWTYWGFNVVVTSPLFILYGLGKGAEWVFDRAHVGISRMDSWAYPGLWGTRSLDEYVNVCHQEDMES